MAGLALVGFAIWFAVEIAILREVHWLHIVWGTPVLVGIWAALPLIPEKTENTSCRIKWLADLLPGKFGTAEMAVGCSR